jgi:UDPglucose 6-dehydrogenase
MSLVADVELHESELCVGVVGVGYVGLTTAAGLAHLGHRVVGVDIDPDRVEQLKRGSIAMREPGLAETVTDGVDAGRLDFTTDLQKLATAQVVFVAVPTPATASGEADLRAVRASITALSRILTPGSTVVLKSTVPVGTTRRCTELVASHGVHLVSNPEFLREGRALHDFLHPDRIVVGADSELCARLVGDLYTALDAPVLFTSPESAELAKYTSNALLALRLSFVNELADLCAHVGADIREVARCAGADNRIGSSFLSPGPGWGGSCLPKDTAALLQSSEDAGIEFSVLKAAVQANRLRPDRVVSDITAAVTGSRAISLEGRRIALLGITFKAGTADIRDSPALAVAAGLQRAGVALRAYDPTLTAADTPPIPDMTLTDDPYAAADEADGIVVLTEWPQFATLDWTRMANATTCRIIVDTRNIVDEKTVAAQGFTLYGNGFATR